MTKILVIEDEQLARDALAYNLRREGFTLVLAPNARVAVTATRQAKPDLILLDPLLPGGSTSDICRRIRAFSSAPIILLTARGEDIFRVLTLEIGADDYVPKPFSLRELVATIKANVKRVSFESGGEDIPEQAGVRLNVSSREVCANGRALHFKPKEFELLVHLMRHAGEVFTRRELLSTVWAHEPVGIRTVDVHVRRVRARLERAGVGDVIRTVYGLGYGFDPSHSEAISDSA